MVNEAMQFTLSVAGGADSDQQELDELTGQLRRRLLELDVDAVEPVRGDEIPPGAKPADPVTVGALLVTLAPVVLQSVVALVETWAQQRRVRSVKVTIDGDSIELTGAPPHQQEQLVRLLVEKHARR